MLSISNSSKSFNWHCELFEKDILFIGRRDKYKFVVDYGNDKEDITDI